MRKARGWRRGMAVVLSVGMGGALAMTASAEETSGYQVNEELVSADAATLNLYGPDRDYLQMQVQMEMLTCSLALKCLDIMTLLQDGMSCIQTVKFTLMQSRGTAGRRILRLLV